MSFFKKYNGTTNVRLARMETLIWTLIYGGLLAVVVGRFSGGLTGRYSSDPDPRVVAG